MKKHTICLILTLILLALTTIVCAAVGIQEDPNQSSASTMKFTSPSLSNRGSNPDFCLQPAVEYRFRDLGTGRIIEDSEIIYLTAGHDYELSIYYQLNLAAGLESTHFLLYLPTIDLHSIPLTTDRTLYLYVDFASGGYVINSERFVRAEFLPCRVQNIQNLKIVNAAFPEGRALSDEIFTTGLPIDYLGNCSEGKIILTFHAEPVYSSTNYLIAGVAIVAIVYFFGVRRGYRKLKRDFDQDLRNIEDRYN